MEKYNKKGEKLKIERYEQGVILPVKNVDGAPMWGLGGVVDKDKKFCEKSFYDGGWATQGGFYQWDCSMEKYVDEKVLYVGIFFSHWGHFLIDVITRFWGIAQLMDENETFKIAYIGDEVIKGNNLKLLKCLGINEEDIIWVKEATRFKEVILCEQGFKSCSMYSIEHIQMLDMVIEKSLAEIPKDSHLYNWEKVYFSRRKFNKAVKDEFGEEYIEKCFVANGFISVAPETLTLEEQIFVWNHAKEIVCINGSIPINVMFSKNRDLKLVILNKTSIKHENPDILLEMRGIKATYIDVYKEPCKNYPKSLGAGPFLMTEYKDLNEYLLKEGMKKALEEGELNDYIKKETRSYYVEIIGIRRRFDKLKYLIYQKLHKA